MLLFSLEKYILILQVIDDDDDDEDKYGNTFIKN